MILIDRSTHKANKVPEPRVTVSSQILSLFPIPVFIFLRTLFEVFRESEKGLRREEIEPSLSIPDVTLGSCFELPDFHLKRFPYFNLPSPEERAWLWNVFWMRASSQ